MKILHNRFRGASSGTLTMDDVPLPSIAKERPMALLKRCPHASITPLVASDALAQSARVGALWVKDERDRMGLGSFKALGAAYVIARDAENNDAQGATYVTASAGNHGLSVAAGASAFGANAVVYLSDTVPEAFAERLRALGADVVRHGHNYEASMEGAAQAASAHGWRLLSDSSWPGYFERPHILMEGYLALMAEVIDQTPEAPSHIFLQAGVGGLAGACAALARQAWGDGPIIVVVEPDAAPALYESILAGKSVVSSGPVSAMGRLDCKEPSLIALKGLARDADFFTIISEAEGDAGAALCAATDLHSTPSGAAGIAALIAAKAQRDALHLTAQARVLVILSEGPES